jgi:preprotein translocase subunit YajC
MTVVALALLAASTKAKTPTSSSYSFLLVILLIGVAGYFFFIRPQQQRAKKVREQQSSYEIGDEILTVGGIVGRIVDLTAERVTIISGETDDGEVLGEEPTRLVLVRRAIAQKIQPSTPDVEVDDEWEDRGEVEEEEHDEDEHDGHDGHDHDEAEHDEVEDTDEAVEGENNK